MMARQEQEIIRLRKEQAEMKAFQSEQDKTRMRLDREDRQVQNYGQGWASDMMTWRKSIMVL